MTTAGDDGFRIVFTTYQTSKWNVFVIGIVGVGVIFNLLARILSQLVELPTLEI